MTGFPGIWSSTPDSVEDVVKTRMLQFGTVSSAQHTEALDGFDHQKHLLLEAKTEYVLNRAGDETYLRTRRGFSAQLPGDLGGISGCSVWMIGDLRLPIHEWRPQDARIVGIETAVYRQRGAIRATRWGAVSSVIYQTYPDLRDALEIYRPVTVLGWR